MKNKKCPQCGLVNFAEASVCRRCGNALDTPDTDPDLDPGAEGAPPGLLRRALILFVVIISVLAIWYLSLIGSSQRITDDERRQVTRAIDILEAKGFGSQAFILRHLANYRATDNWWNRMTGHSDAFAATNFPFEVVTLYPDFFKLSADDTERAVMLLHEASHLEGHGEETALVDTWKAKSRLGWNADRYGNGRVWKSTRELTRNMAGWLFQCGPDRQSDCTEE